MVASKSYSIALGSLKSNPQKFILTSVDCFFVLKIDYNILIMLKFDWTINQKIK
ncbi:hypothetical protein J19TS1_47910 [Heyndrickxia oleronia]|nr:hypothetical protein J19TS1_47910 [Heyndrickxia oleronia]